MKILSNLETILINHHISYSLPHLAIELKVKNQEYLEDGQQLEFKNYLFNFSATVFKPGDGSRLILKAFHVEYISGMAPKWWQKILGIFLVKNIVYLTKPHSEVVTDLLHFFETAGSQVLYLGKIPTTAFTLALPSE